MRSLGFIGLGIMGKPMCKNLLRKTGGPLVVHDINGAPVEELVALGAKRADSAKALAAQSDVILTMLPNSPDVKAVVLGRNGVLEGAKPGAILVDMSSIAPLASREIAARASEAGVEMLDAPVSGGEPKAIEGTLAFMVGGKKSVFDQVKDILATMGASVTLVGAIGSGNLTKLANQIIVALNIAAVSEALVLAAKAGVDPEKVYQAIRGGLAGSAVLDAKAPLDDERQLQAGLPHRTAHQGPAERVGYGARVGCADSTFQPGHGDHAGPPRRRQGGQRSRRPHSVLRTTGRRQSPHRSLTKQL